MKSISKLRDRSNSPKIQLGHIKSINHRSIASEVDYSDIQSIRTTVTTFSHSKKRSKSSSKHALIRRNINLFNRSVHSGEIKPSKIGSFSEAKSQISKFSMFSKLSKASLRTQSHESKCIVKRCPSCEITYSVPNAVKK